MYHRIENVLCTALRGSSVIFGGGFTEREKIERINYLAAKSKSQGLTDEEKAEQQALRTEYRENFKKNFMSQLDRTYTVDENGNKRKLI